MHCARMVAVVVPSPAVSEVFDATSRTTGEPEQAVEVVLVLDGTELAAGCEGEVAAGAGGSGTLVDEGGGVGDESVDLAEQVASQVDAM